MKWLSYSKTSILDTTLKLKYPKASKLEKLKNERNKIILQLRNIVSILDFNHLLNFINSVNDKKVSKIQHTQNKKLFNIGLHHEVTRLNPQKLIFNYSDKILTPDEIETLSHGLKFALPPSKINYSRWFLAFEKLFLKLKDCKIFDTSNDGLNYIKSSLKSIAFKNYYSFRPHVNSLQKKFLATLKELKSDPNIVVLKSDKGNAIVILNKQDYHSKMNNILSDTSKFKLITDDLLNVLITKEDKINRLLSKLKKKEKKLAIVNLVKCMQLAHFLVFCMDFPKFIITVLPYDPFFRQSELLGIN